MLEVSERDNVMKEHRLEQMFMVDFYLPKQRLVIEINGKDHFYPYTYKKNNVTNLKSKMLREWSKSGPQERHYFVLNLNVQFLHGLSKEPRKLQDFLARMIDQADKSHIQK